MEGKVGNQESQEKLLTREQISQVLNFSQALYMAENGMYTPFTQNQLLRDLNNNPSKPKMEELKRALANYKDSASDLISYTEFMQKWDMIFARTVKSYTSILSFDLQIVCTNAFTDADYNSEKYKKDKNKIYNFLDSFDYKAEFRKVLEQVMTSEIGYYWFRRTKWNNKGMKNTLQLMPQKYCMVTDYWEKGLLYDFDMTFFQNPSVDIDGFDPVFKKYFKNVFGDNQNNYKYIPTNDFNNRQGHYAMWTQTSPNDGAWAKFNNSR